MRIVLDTNVFISSFFGGNPKKIIDLWKEGKVVICLSGPIIDEYIAVLKRLGLEGKPELKELLDFLAEGFNLIFAAKTPSLNIVHDDPDDNKFIECAVALEAEVIVSGDKNLLRLKNYLNIKIMSPAEFLNSFKRKP